MVYDNTCSLRPLFFLGTSITTSSFFSSKASIFRDAKSTVKVCYENQLGKPGLQERSRGGFIFHYLRVKQTALASDDVLVRSPGAQSLKAQPWAGSSAEHDLIRPQILKEERKKEERAGKPA